MSRRTRTNALDVARRENRPLTVAEFKAITKPKALTEHDEQVRLVRWVREAVVAYPDLEAFAAIPNQGGGKIGSGHHVRQARMKAEGLAPGYPDTLLDAPRGGWHGLRVELKRGAYWPDGWMGPMARGEPTADQTAWHHRLARRGYCVWIAWGWEAARDVYLWYLQLPEPWRLTGHTTVLFNRDDLPVGTGINRTRHIIL